MNRFKNYLLKLSIFNLLIQLIRSCSNLDFTRLPNDCSKFYRCSNNILYTFDCPPGLLFDESVKVCNYANMVNCNAHSTTIGMISTIGTNSGI